MKFRTDINGLRAIAVMAVVLFHFNPSWVPGGFAGVDVFFVISGFLMTGLIFRGLENNNFSIINFYVARANRIIPALSVVCLALLVFGWIYLYPSEYRTLGKHIASSMGFLSNIFYWLESGYFTAAAKEKWLLHTWSLSVEWQFYMIYPVVLVLLKKCMSLTNIKRLLVVGTVVGFIFSVYATYRWPNPAYFLFPTRAWEMMMGGLAFLYPLQNLKETSKKYFEWAGIALILASYAFISKDNLWPGYLALIPVLGAYLVIIANRSGSVITDNVVMQKVGLWSYSIYLWHWPVAVFIYTSSYGDNLKYQLLGIIISVVLGWFSYSFIESNLSLKKKRIYIPSLCLCMLLASCIYLLNGVVFKYRPISVSEKVLFVNKYEQYHKNLSDAYWLKCNSYTSLSKNGNLDIDKECTEKKGNGGVFLWGDSHAEALSLGLRTDFKGIPFYQVTSAGCKPSLYPSDQNGIFKIACDNSNSLALKTIKQLQPKVVIMAQANSHEKTNWNEIAKRLESLGVKNIIVVGPVSQWKPSLPIVVAKRHFNDTDDFISDVGIDLDIIKTNEVMKKYQFSSDITYISLIDKLCHFEGSKISCKARVNHSDLLQVDYGHLSKEGSLDVVSNLIQPKVVSLLNR